jgi:hypothetical protein
MSSLEDGFGGGVDDIVSANYGIHFGKWAVTGSRALAAWHSRCASASDQVLFAVPWCQIANEWHRTYGARSYAPAGILELHDGNHLALLRHHMHVAAATPSRSYALH